LKLIDLTEISGNMFKHVPDAIDFRYAFSKSGLKSLPIGLFKYNTKAEIFEDTFGYSQLESIPDDLFKYNNYIASGRSYSTFIGNPNLKCYIILTASLN
jgi:hypothetical protein